MGAGCGVLVRAWGFKFGVSSLGFGVGGGGGGLGVGGGEVEGLRSRVSGLGLTVSCAPSSLDSGLRV